LTYKEKVTCKTSTEKLDTKKRVVCDINICQEKAVIFWRYYAKWKFQEHNVYIACTPCCTT